MRGGRSVRLAGREPARRRSTPLSITSPVVVMSFKNDIIVYAVRRAACPRELERVAGLWRGEVNNTFFGQIPATSLPGDAAIATATAARVPGTSPCARARVHGVMLVFETDRRRGYGVQPGASDGPAANYQSGGQLQSASGERRTVTGIRDCALAMQETCRASAIRDTNPLQYAGDELQRCIRLRHPAAQSDSEPESACLRAHGDGAVHAGECVAQSGPGPRGTRRRPLAASRQPAIPGCLKW